MDSAPLRVPADLPDHPGAGDLYERPVPGPRTLWARLDFELRARIALAEIAHGPIVDHIQGAIGTKHRRDGPVDTVEFLGERLVAGNFAGRAAVGIMSLIRLLAVEGEARLRKPQGLARPTEVH